MSKDFEDIHDIENLDDDSLRELVYQELTEYPEIDPDLVDVEVDNGRVRLSGRVGTEQELQQVEYVVSDVLGVQTVTNDLVIDELVRGERPEAADDAAAADRAIEPQLGRGEERTSDTASHLIEDSKAEMFGTQDVQEAVAGGLSYEPPDRPIQEGTRSRENH